LTGRRRPRHPSFLPALAALSFLGLALLGWSGVASAQFGGQPGGMGPGMGPQPDEPKEEGPAEAAPDDEKEGPSEASPLGGYPGQQRKMTRIVTFDGYLRLRTDFFHKLNLGQGYVTDPGLTPPVGAPDALRPPPFPLPLECPRMEMPCEFNNFGSGNTRFRLEPTINVTDQVRVHSQIDILDNTIMGSTPDSLVLVTDPAARTGRAPLGALSTTQDPPEIGRNGYMSSIRAKRAWAEVDTEFGSLKFGRMPWHFGRGMTYNNGACMDCEGGTTVDRVLGQISVYGHKVTLSWDWGASGYHMGMTDLGRRDLEGFPLDLSQEDDVFQLMGSIALLDDEQRFRERVEMGELAVNYGLQLVYRQQNNEVFDAAMSGTPGAMAPSLMDGGTLTRDRLAASIIKGVDALIFQPSVWFKLGWKALTIELEGSAVLGTIENAGPLVQDNNPNKKLTLQQIGWVLATELRLYRNAFFLGFETGGATGDQAEDPFSHLNYRWRSVRQPAGDTRITDFKFNPDYQVDQILFRRILGTVSNALYFKPLITYWLDLVESRQIGLQAAGVYSVAPVQVSTPGNSLSYGIELDLGLHYRNPADGFFAGLTYSVLWPMGALDRGIGSGSGTGTFTETQDAETSQVLRFFLGVRF
jgi:uncharacterized protein (TIGR04551 family)